MLLIWLSARTISIYLRLSTYGPALRFIMFAVLLFCTRYLVCERAGEDSGKDIGKGERKGKRKGKRKRKTEAIVIALWSAAFTASIILGYHLHIGKAYSGTMQDNYITPYHWTDLLSFFLLFGGFFIAARTLCCLIMHSLPLCRRQKIIPQRLPDCQDLSDCQELPDCQVLSDCRKSPKTRETDTGKHLVFELWLLLFAAWFPYLLLYWPGLVMGDTLTSLQQILGINGWTTQHPVFYNLFIKMCLGISHALGMGNTMGCALYTVIQMSFMAFAIARMISWILKHTGLKRPVGWMMAICFGFTPYVASYSVAMWKDPVFSSAVILFSLELYDQVIGDEVKQEKNRPLFHLILYGMILACSRTNGIYLMAFTAVFLIGALLFYGFKTGASKGKPGVTRRLWRALIVVLLISGLFLASRTVAYHLLDVSEKKEETVGILLNQMARAAVGGELSESDSEYMNRLLPLEKYEEIYAPCTTDRLKWDPDFDSDALSDGFMKHWFSIFMKNPRIFFEAWELETCGFWAVNVPEVNKYARNINGGVPRNINDELVGQLADYDIVPANLTGSIELRTFFRLNEWSVPVSWIIWLVLYAAALLLISGRPYRLILLMPSGGLIATLLLATPVWYWPRYGAALQFMLPVYLSLLMI